MDSAGILFQTLRTITQTKLEAHQEQCAAFENTKSGILGSLNTIPDVRKRIRFLLDVLQKISSIKQSSFLSAGLPTNLPQLLTQAETDPSISQAILKDWEQKLRHKLDIQSIRHEYASLYGKLVVDWLVESNSVAPVAEKLTESLTLSGHTKQQEQRADWEEYVFHQMQTDVSAIRRYREDKFCYSKMMREGLDRMRVEVRKFEDTMKAPNQFDEDSLRWCIEGLRRSDLLNDQKKDALDLYRKDKALLAELADYLNMKMESVETWSWPEEGIAANMRRNLNGKYRVFHDEDIFNALFLRYIGVKWSVHVQHALTTFSSECVWRAKTLPRELRDQRAYYLGKNARDDSLEEKRRQIFMKRYFLAQLQREENEVGRSYSEYDAEDDKGLTVRETPSDLKQSLLHLLSAEVVVHTRLSGEIAVIRSDFKSFGPSLPHSTIFAVLEFFGVSAKWINFFKRTLEIPLRFTEDGPGASVRVRKRGTPNSSPLADVFAETVMYCLDIAVTKATDELRLYRLHDDSWFWGSESMCAKAWKSITDFEKLMGLKHNREKTGSQEVFRMPERPRRTLLDSILPAGEVRWGFLILDQHGRFVIDNAMVDEQIKELRSELDACKSILAWVQVYNTFAVRYLSSMFGKPSNAFGREHIDMLLRTFKKIERSLFSNDKPHLNLTITSYVQEKIRKRFGVNDIPDGYLYFPTELGGLDLRNPFIPLSQVRSLVLQNPNECMDEFFTNEKEAYRLAKEAYEAIYHPRIPNQFLSFDEYSQNRELASKELCDAFEKLLEKPKETEYKLNRVLAAGVTKSQWTELSPYHQWIVQTHGPNMVEKFGGLQIVDRDLLPVGMVSALRSKRLQLQG